MNWKSYALASGVSLIATYLATAPPRPGEAPTGSRRQDARARVESDVRELAVELRARVRAEVEYRAPARNLFRFDRGAVAPPPAPIADVPAVAPVVPPPAPRRLPAVSLAGVAEDRVNGVVQRTAILATDLGVLMVREGDAVGTDYRVGTISGSSVELLSIADGAIRTVSFTP